MDWTTQLRRLIYSTDLNDTSHTKVIIVRHYKHLLVLGVKYKFHLTSIWPGSVIHQSSATFRYLHLIFRDLERTLRFVNVTTAYAAQPLVSICTEITENKLFKTRWEKIQRGIFFVFFKHLFSLLPLWEHLFEMKRIHWTCSSTWPQPLLQMNWTKWLLFPTVHRFQNQHYMNSKRCFVRFCRTKLWDIPNQLESWSHLFRSKS